MNNTEAYTTNDGWRELQPYHLRYPNKKWATHKEGRNTITRAVSYGMPKISAQWLDAVFYLYASESDANSGSMSGGTGFLVSYPLEIKGRPEKHWAVYAVSNWHVVCKKGNTVARLHTKDGETVTFPTESADWLFIPGSNDVAITTIPLDDSVIQYMHVPIETFIKEDDDEIGIGDDVFMLGRFVDSEHDGTNAPSARFGNISMMPKTINDGDGHDLLSYCLDMHSRSGYSGSPVFVYRTPGGDLTKRGLNLSSTRLMLLGIHWGQYAEYWELKDSKEPVHEGSLISDGKKIKGLSGMTCVAPAWDILKVLELPEFVMDRKRSEMALFEEYKDKPLPPMLESADDSDAETLRDETLGRMLNTPPKPRTQ